MSDGKKARMVGVNHVVLEVGDLDEALDFYGRLFDIRLRARRDNAAFVDMGDQFLQFSLGKTQP
ncbi:MAG: VOC family protein, partial [Alphaproteobacteria bacterium]